MEIQEVKRESFEELVLKSKKPVLLDFYTSACSHCRTMEVILKAVAEARPDISVVKMNVEGASDICAAYGVSRVPTLLAIKEGSVTARQEGACSKATVLQML